MFEFVPFAVAAVFAALFSRFRMRLGPSLLVAVAVAIGLYATLVSGEYVAGWRTLPLDTAIAGAGMIVGAIFARAVTRAYRSRVYRFRYRFRI